MGIALDTAAAAAPTLDVTPDVAGLYADSRASPRFLLPAGRDSGRETDPTGVSVEPRWGVTASVEGGDETMESSYFTPLVFAGVERPSASAGRKMTRIFLSWMDDLEVCSILDH